MDSSPVRTVKNPCPASSPAINRIPVPELPQSMGPNGFRQSHAFAMDGQRVWRLSSIRTPSDWKARMVFKTIFAATIGRHGARPSAKAVRMMARWVTDLSPGTIRVPFNGRPGVIVNDAI